MASEDGQMSHDLDRLEALKQAPEKFSFFFALRCIESAAKEAPRLGESARPKTDPVRLDQTPSLSFANSTISTYKGGEEGTPPRLSSYFLGLFGPNGALPVHLTEHACNRMHHHNDPTFTKFVDLFHHRMLSLFYRAWANKEPTVNFDRDESDPFKKYIGALFGQGMDSFHHRDELPDRAKLFYSGSFANQVRNADGLADILSGYCKVPVAVNELIGEWMPMPEESQWQLGKSEETGVLNLTTIVGNKIWGCQHKFRLCFGPLKYSEFRRLLPGGSDLKAVVATVKNYVGIQLDWDMNLVLQKDEIPSFKLGGDSQLGWSTWLNSDQASTHHSETIIKGYNHG